MFDLNNMEIVRQNRKSIAITVTDECKVRVKAPLAAPDSCLREFAEKNRDWLEKKMAEKAEIMVKNAAIVEKIMRTAKISQELLCQSISGRVRLSDGAIFLKVPYGTTKEQIEEYVVRNREWLEKHSCALRKMATKGSDVYTAEQIEQLMEQALDYLPERVQKWAPLVGVNYRKVKIMTAKQRWGSCNSSGDLHFNCLLMLCPEDIRDSVIVHELCHRLEMNHSPKFYANVLRVMPDYEEKRQWMKTEGQKIIEKFARSKLPRVAVRG